jgi:hypothetical protein
MCVVLFVSKEFMCGVDAFVQKKGLDWGNRGAFVKQL